MLANKETIKQQSKWNWNDTYAVKWKPDMAPGPRKKISKMTPNKVRKEVAFIWRLEVYKALEENQD